MLDNIEVQKAAEAYRQARRQLRDWEKMYDTDRGGDPTRFISHIQAAERALETARLELRRLGRQ
jgi:hypothetical protein